MLLDQEQLGIHRVLLCTRDNLVADAAIYITNTTDGILNRDPSHQVAADLRPEPLGRRGRLISILENINRET
jgi:hypothetical protein